eukprot:CAMPEP_0185845110 /NCGR_PEP_ID=MMETSP1354-20130828/1167_1 /TAXON_ID=708628 /ORGANISM="Erythrolobus madagascarensis, Strain CCMP3276" /LENGTH=144 /DNA_ID=CAMNT_0028544999 /DNA_START=53 /DNA_END=487 /DNA_ORIENTATION=-
MGSADRKVCFVGSTGGGFNAATRTRRDAKCSLVRMSVGKDDEEIGAGADQKASNASGPLISQAAGDTADESSGSKNECSGCGREGGPKKGCDGQGRIAGGMTALVDWWPIKAYRPCDELLKSKREYKRAGQSLEEIAFGRKGLE